MFFQMKKLGDKSFEITNLRWQFYHKLYEVPNHHTNIYLRNVCLSVCEFVPPPLGLKVQKLGRRTLNWAEGWFVGCQNFAMKFAHMGPNFLIFSINWIRGANYHGGQFLYDTGIGLLFVTASWFHLIVLTISQKTIPVCCDWPIHWLYPVCSGYFMRSHWK